MVRRFSLAVLGLCAALVATLSELRGFRFRLFSPEGDDFGEYETVARSWCAGDEFTAGDGRLFRLLGIVPVTEGVRRYNAFWIVEPLD
jgi:hypothetical protein